MGLFNRRHTGGFISVYKYLKGGFKADGDRLFSLMGQDQRQRAQTKTQESLYEH